MLPEPEIVARAVRRQLPTGYKRRIVEEAEPCTQPGKISVLLRREGLYSSILANWRRPFRQYGMVGLAGNRTGRPQTPNEVLELRRLRAENERLTKKLAQAELIIDVQRKWRRCSGSHSHLSTRRCSGDRRGDEPRSSNPGDGGLRRARGPRADFYRQRPRVAHVSSASLEPAPAVRRRPHSRALVAEERQRVLDTLHSPRFRDWARLKLSPPCSLKGATWHRNEECTGFSPPKAKPASGETSWSIQRTPSPSSWRWGPISSEAGTSPA